MRGNIKCEVHGRRYNASADESCDSLHVHGLWRRKDANLAEEQFSYQLADFKNEARMLKPRSQRIQRHRGAARGNGRPWQATVSFNRPIITTWRSDCAWSDGGHACRLGPCRKRLRAKMLLCVWRCRAFYGGHTVTIPALCTTSSRATSPRKISARAQRRTVARSSDPTVTIRPTADIALTGV